MQLGDDLRALVATGHEDGSKARTEKVDLPKEMRPRLTMGEDGGEFVTSPKAPIAGEPVPAGGCAEFGLDPAQWRGTRTNRSRRQLAAGAWRANSAVSFARAASPAGRGAKLTEKFSVSFAPRPAGEAARAN